jgi:hypothetical protein
MSDSTESSEEVTYIFNTGSSSSTSTSSNTQMFEIDHELNTEPIDSADVGYVENYVVNKRDSKYSDLQNLLEYGYFAAPLKDLVRLHNKGLIETTEDIRKVQDMTIEITSLLKKVDKYEVVFVMSYMYILFVIFTYDNLL